LTQIAEYTVKRLALIALVFLFVLSVATPLIQPAKAVAYSYTFNGPYYETTGNDIFVNSSPADIWLTIHYADSTPTSTAVFNGAYTLTPTSKPLYFSITIYFNVTGVATLVPFTREYWLGPNENTGTYNIYSEKTTVTYVISFMDQVGLLKTYPYIEAQILMNGTYQTVEKKIVDVQNIVSMELIEGQRYRILFGDGATTQVYGDLTTTATTGIQLILRGVDFPKETLLLYQYVHASAIRDFLNPIGAITVSYEDTTSQTTSVTVTITSNGTTVYSNVFTSQLFSYTWNSAVNATSYEVTVAIVHVNFGSFNYKYYLQGQYEKPVEPFSLAFLGSTMGISTAVLIPALLIIFVAGCFSEITAETAAILTVIIAIILSALGWIEISQAAIITALALSVLAGIITAKRRLNTY
jgi:hypothetical protein